MGNHEARILACALLDVRATLARIERELPPAPYRVKEGIHFCLVWIGIHLPAYTAEAIAIGERLGRCILRPFAAPPQARSAKEPEPMNVLLWVLQVALAFVFLSGGAYKAFSFDEVAKQLSALPLGAWRALGVFEMVGAVLLIIPAALKWKPHLTRHAAAALALESLALAGLYASYSLDVAVTNPLVWSVVLGLLAAFVAYGRYVLRPTASPGALGA